MRVRVPRDHAQFARDVISNGICFVFTEWRGKPFFSPCLFVGYRQNSRHDYLRNRANKNRDGSKAIAAMKKFLPRPRPDKNLDREYETFCSALQIEVKAKAPFGRKRKYWDLR